jgi:hypothetical protein
MYITCFFESRKFINTLLFSWEEVMWMMNLRELIRKKIIEGKIGLEDLPLLLLCGLASCNEKE